MNRHEIRHLFSPQFATRVGSKLVVVLGTIFFWLIMFALLSTPAWLPGLIERSVGR